MHWHSDGEYYLAWVGRSNNSHPKIRFLKVLEVENERYHLCSCRLGRRLFTAIFGGWDSALVTLVVFMAIDFFTGIITAMMKKSKHTESGGLSSKAGWFGLAKKVCTLMLIVVAVRMDILLNTNYIRDAVCISFCLNELLSIVENTSLMGIPYPPAIKKAIDVLQTKIGRTEETTDKEDK